MKVYVVFKFNAFDDVVDKIFSTKEKAHEYIDKMDASTDFGWMCCEMEVEE